MNLFDIFESNEQELDEDLRKWFKDKWVRFGPDGEIRGDCARGDDSEGKPKCLPQSKAQNLGKKGRASAAARKRREDPNPERSGKAINVNTKKKSNEGVAEGSMKDLHIDLQDQQWDAIVGYVITGLKKNMDIGHMELNLYKYAGQEMFDVDQELQDRGFKDIADLADHIKQHNGKYVPPTDFDLGKGVTEGLVGDVVVHNYTKIPIDLEPGQAQIAGWGPNDEPLYRVKGQDGKEVKTWSKRRMLTIAKEQGVAEAINPDITNPAFSHQQQIGDYLYVARYWSKGLKITAYHGAKQIGYAELMYHSAPFDDFADPKTTPKRIWLESEWTKVDPKYQRQGIMSTMYAYAKMLGNSVKPSQTRSDDAKAAWKSWRDAGDAQHLTREGVAEGQLDEISQDTARSYAQKATQSKKDLINQTYRKGADTDKLNKKIQNRQQGLNRAHTDKRYYNNEQGVAEGSKNLSYIGNCTDDDVIEYIFGDATNFAQAVEEHGDEFTIDDLVVKYDPETDVHSFYYKQQGVAEAFGPLPRERQQIRLGRHTVDIERVGLDKNYISFAWNDSQGQEHYEEVPVGDLGSYDDLIDRIKDEIRYQERQYTDQGVAEEQLDEKCWDTHKQVGMKKKGNRMVPNCVPKESIEEMAGKTNPDAVRRIQQLLNKKFDANLDIDGILGPLTLKSIKKFLPKSTEKQAPNPEKTTAVQGKQVKEEKCPHCGGEMVSEELINEKKDACYYKVKSRYKVWPSAYASGALVKCRKKGAKNWGNKSEGVAEDTEMITELRNRMYQYIKSILPKWPEYVLKDWVYGLARGDHQAGVYFKPDDSFDRWGFNRETILKMIANHGLSPDTQWQLIPNVKFTMDMFEPNSKRKLIGRAGGHSDMGMGITKDKERHATQAALAQKQGGVRKEPVILIKTPQGYELLEGWHRTIQHFVKYPDGYVGPAYVAVAQSQQGVAEGLNEMDKTQTPPGRDGDIDWTKKQIHLGPEHTMKAKDVAKHALKILNKTMKKSHADTPKKKGVAEEQLDEKWSQKYKDSINCSNPKGFSQKAHCAGEKKNEDIAEGKEYYTVTGTDSVSLRRDFNMAKDRNGWYLKEGATPKQKLEAFRAFGSPKLKEFNLAAFSGGTQTKGEDNVISPVGSQTRAQYKK